MNTEIVTGFKYFYIDFEAIIDLMAGFDDYFAKHPEEKRGFPHCNAKGRKKIKSREMFIGKKTEAFSKLLQLLTIEVDSAHLEAEYYLTPHGKGKIYKYTNGANAIYFDFYIDPTAQIECCGIAVSYPTEKRADIMKVISELNSASKYVVDEIYDGDLKSFIKEHKKAKKTKPLFLCYQKNRFDQHVEKALNKMFKNKKLSMLLPIGVAAVVYLLFLLFTKADDKSDLIILTPIVSVIWFFGVFFMIYIQKLNVNCPERFLNALEFFITVIFGGYAAIGIMLFVISDAQSYNLALCMGAVTYSAVSRAHNKRLK